MTRIAFGLVYFGLCLGEFVRIQVAAFFSRSRRNPPSRKCKAVVWLHYHDLWLLKQHFFFLSLCLSLCVSATIKSQFIEVSHDSVHVGDDVTLKCFLTEEAAQDAQDVTKYVWYLNSESLEQSNFYRFLFFLFNRWDLLPLSFFLNRLFLFVFFSIRNFHASPEFSRLSDKKVINNEHFLQRDNELTINNAEKHLSGYYSCVVEFLNSGAKLETPHELINVVGEYSILDNICWRSKAFPCKLTMWSDRN